MNPAGYILVLNVGPELARPDAPAGTYVFGADAIDGRAVPGSLFPDLEAVQAFINSMGGLIPGLIAYGMPVFSDPTVHGVHIPVI